MSSICTVEIIGTDSSKQPIDIENGSNRYSYIIQAENVAFTNIKPITENLSGKSTATMFDRLNISHVGHNAAMETKDFTIESELKIKVNVHFEDGWYCAQATDYPEIITQAKSIEELKENISDAAKLIFDYHVENSTKGQ
mgnify:CR=1 FL=1|jgi:predicted RNase H-like HicB family nuclease